MEYKKLKNYLAKPQMILILCPLKFLRKKSYPTVLDSFNHIYKAIEEDLPIRMKDFMIKLVATDMDGTPF